MPLRDHIKAAQGSTGQPAGGAPAAGAAQVALAAPLRDNLREYKAKTLKKLIAEMERQVDGGHPDEVRRYLEERLVTIMEQDQVVMGRQERQQLLDLLVADITGYGPIEPLLSDPTIDEIMVNGANEIYIEREGMIEEVTEQFESDQHVMRIIDRIVSPLGRRIDESSPYVDARLPDGSRVNVIIPPLSLNGPTITIRKFAKVPFSVDDLIQRGTLVPEIVDLIRACVQAELNIVISGGTGAGKTTLLNVISSFIPPRERIITIEDSAELQLRQKHVIRLETRPANIEGKGEVSRRDLVTNALRMRPDRIIVGECRAGEALDMLQAMNTGHEGSMTTVHSNSPRDALHRIETMVLMAGYDLPLRAIREQISSALDLIVHVERMRDGTRKIVSLVEIQGMEGDVIVTQEIFKFDFAGPSDGKVLGHLKPTGIKPRFVDKIQQAGILLAPSVFGADPRQYRQRS